MALTATATQTTTDNKQRTEKGSIKNVKKAFNTKGINEEGSKESRSERVWYGVGPSERVGGQEKGSIKIPGRMKQASKEDEERRNIPRVIKEE